MHPNHLNCSHWKQLLYNIYTYRLLVHMTAGTELREENTLDTHNPHNTNTFRAAISPSKDHMTSRTSRVLARFCGIRSFRRTRIQNGWDRHVFRWNSYKIYIHQLLITLGFLLAVYLILYIFICYVFCTSLIPHLLNFYENCTGVSKQMAAVQYKPLASEVPHFLVMYLWSHGLSSFKYVFSCVLCFMRKNIQIAITVDSVHRHVMSRAV